MIHSLPFSCSACFQEDFCKELSLVSNIDQDMNLFENYNNIHDDAVTVGCTVMVVVVGYLLIRKWRVSNPPGPVGVPLLGYAPFLGKNPGETMMRLKKHYGPVMSMKLGTRSWIILNDLPTATEAFSSKSDASSSRVPSPLASIMSQNGHGIFSADYCSTWKSLRKFGQMNLRGSGPKGLESLVMEEVPFLLRNLTCKTKDPLRDKLILAVGNTINTLLFGTRSTYDDEMYRSLLILVTDVHTDSFNAKLLGLVHLIPVFRHFPVFSGTLRSFENDFKLRIGILKKIIADHKEKYHENDIRDFIDAFLKKMDGTEDGAFSEKQLIHCLRDIYQAGIGSTATTLLWIILAFATYPEMQEKVYQEVDATLGSNGVVTMKHRPQMSYTCAFIQEIMRHRTIGSISAPHKTDKEIDLCGYKIPKNSAILCNLWAINHDPDTFKNPEEFTPDRFIDGEGKFVSCPQVVPFGIGPRICMGEHLAREEVFLITTCIVQKLRVVPDPANPIPAFSDGNFNMFTYECPDFEVNFEVR